MILTHEEKGNPAAILGPKDLKWLDMLVLGEWAFYNVNLRGGNQISALVDRGGSGVWSELFPDKLVTNYYVPFFLPRRRQYLPKQASPHWPSAQPVWESSKCILETAYIQLSIRCFRD